MDSCVVVLGVLLHFLPQSRPISSWPMPLAVLFPSQPIFHSNPSLRRPITLGITPIELGNNMLFIIYVGVACIRMDGRNSSSPRHPSPSSSATPLKRSEKSEYAAISARSFRSISLSYTIMIDIIARVLG